MYIGQFTKLLDETFLNKVSGEVFIVDREAVYKDIQKLEQIECMPELPEMERKALRLIKKDLHKILKESNNTYNTLKVEIELDKSDFLHNIPFRNLPMYGIRTDKYLRHIMPPKKGTAKQKNLIKVYFDLHEMADLISFELIKNDLGFSNKDLDLKLKRANMISANNIEDYFNFSEEKPYYMGKIMKVEESEYFEDGEMYDYFEIFKFFSNYYKKPVEFSCIYAVLVFLEKLRQELGTTYVVSVYETGLCVMIDSTEEKIKSFLSGELLIRVYKRKFRANVKYEITEYSDEQTLLGINKEEKVNG